MAIEINDNIEAFDMAFALWYWLSHWHGGMRCEKYSAMCQIMGEYGLDNIPSIDFDSDDQVDDEYYMTISYYNDLDEENWKETFEAWREYMDTRWDDEAC